MLLNCNYTKLANFEHCKHAQGAFFCAHSVYQYAHIDMQVCKNSIAAVAHRPIHIVIALRPTRL